MLAARGPPKPAGWAVGWAWVGGYCVTAALIPDDACAAGAYRDEAGLVCPRGSAPRIWTGLRIASYPSLLDCSGFRGNIGPRR